MAKQDTLWELFALGGAHSEGFRAGRQGSARCFAYGTTDRNPGVVITTWDGRETTVYPATPEAVQIALDSLGVTETRWTR